MDPIPSAHFDTFARDHLPPPGEWPRLLLGPPVPRYPDRLNCAAELLDGTIARYGADRTAVLCGTGPGGTARTAVRRWTYGELRDHVDRFARVLTEDLGVVPGNRVLLRGPTGPELAACWLAVLKAGAVAVTVLAAQRARELRAVCAAARAGHALCDVRSLTDLRAAAPPGLRVTPFGGTGADDLLTLARARPGRYTAVPTAADDVALIAHTSGSTGRPKGCAHFHRDVLAVADTFSAQVLRPRPGDLFAGSPPLGFTFGLGGLVVFPLRAGAATVLDAFDGTAGLLDAVERYRVSVLFTAPTAYRGMLRRLGPPAPDPEATGPGPRAERPGRGGGGPPQGEVPGGRRRYDLSALRRCVAAGEDLPAATWRAWHRRTGLRLINGIGATEMLHIFLAAADEHAGPGTLGVPVPGFEARVQDPETGGPVPDGEPGLLAVRGPVGCRYLADARQRAYVRDGWNLTGDTCVRASDGTFRYVARADDMIIAAGYNIAGPEVEEALLRHPDVVEAAVVGRPDPGRGSVVVAHVVLRSGVPAGEAAAADLRAFAAAELTPWKCPREIVFTDALPRTATGKLQRFRLRGAERE